MNAGALDRRLRIEVATETQSASGEVTRTWPGTLLADVWASKRDLSGVELYRAQQLVAKVDTEFEIRYPAGLNPFPNPDETMRLFCEGVPYDITFVSEIGRREGLKLLAFKRAEA
jgi:SPP1 family predicted phage head-tail adaptor